MEENNPVQVKQTQAKSFSFLSNLFVSVFVLGLLLSAFYFLPLKDIKWGKIEFTQPSTIVVTGIAESKEKTQIATFTAGVSAVSDNKDEAVNSVNQKVEGIINAVLKFGIERSDIKTENLNIYQQEETYWDEGRQKTRPGQWRVSNNISIVLRNVDRASELSKVLTQTGATNVYGPNFSFDDTKAVEESLIKDAIENAKNKAQKIADLSGKKLGGIVSVSEGYPSQVIPYLKSDIGLGGGGGGAPIEPGSGTVSKTVTVIFEIK
jgi:hypothetical protein